MSNLGAGITGIENDALPHPSHQQLAEQNGTSTRSVVRMPNELLEAAGNAVQRQRDLVAFLKREWEEQDRNMAMRTNIALENKLWLQHCASECSGCRSSSCFYLKRQALAYSDLNFNLHALKGAMVVTHRAACAWRSAEKTLRDVESKYNTVVEACKQATLELALNVIVKDMPFKIAVQQPLFMACSSTTRQIVTAVNTPIYYPTITKSSEILFGDSSLLVFPGSEVE